MFRTFFLWWLGQLAEMLPAWLRRSAPAESDALVVTPQGQLESVRALTVALRRKGKEVPLGELLPGTADLAGLPLSPTRPVVLRLPQRAILEKVLTLPLAALTELQQVLGFEMDRETPFRAEEVYWSHRIESTDRQNGRLLIRLMLLPKSVLAPLLTALAPAGLAPRWAEIARGDDPPLILPLDGDDLHPRQRSRRAVAAACAGCAVLALAVVVVPFVRQSVALAALDREIAVGTTNAARAERVRREIERLSGSANFARNELGKVGQPLEILAKLTRALPDDTYLTELELRQRKLTLSGRSAGAARLIGALANDGTFRDPAFAAPVTRLEALRTEVFTITADVPRQP